MKVQYDKCHLFISIPNKFHQWLQKSIFVFKVNNCSSENTTKSHLKH